MPKRAGPLRLPQGALLVGVLSVQRADRYNEVIGETWMKHPGVPGKQRPAASIVYGRGKNRSRAAPGET